MAPLRSIEEQFDPSKVERLRALLQRVRAVRLRLPEGATHYHFVELLTTLEAGALLASLHLAASALELFVRALIIDRVSIADQSVSHSEDVFTYQERLEGDRKLTFSKMLDHLVSAGLFRAEDADISKRYYEEVRIPLAHGLLERLMNGRPAEAENPLRLFGPAGFTSAHQFEEVVEERALDHISTVIEVIDRNIDV